MKKETEQKLKGFHRCVDDVLLLSNEFKVFEKYLKHVVSGEGLIGANSYLLLWKKGDVEELNCAYETKTFLNNIILIGSDGSDTAYGIDENGRYIEVPFIGMDEESVEVVAEDFDGFIGYIWGKQ